MRKKYLAAVAIASALAACTFHRATSIQIRVSLPARSASVARTTAGDLSCVFVNLAPPDTAANCLALGDTSDPVVRGSSPISIAMPIRVGEKESVQALGFTDVAASECHGPIGTLLAGHAVYLYGSVTAALYAGSTIDVQPASGPRVPLSGNCGGELHISPNISHLAGGATQTFQLLKDTAAGQVDVTSDTAWQITNSPSGISLSGSTITASPGASTSVILKATYQGEIRTLSFNVSSEIVYIADPGTGDNRILKYTTGLSTYLNSGDQPAGMVFDTDGTLYYTDSYQHVVKKYDGTSVTVVAGLADTNPGNDLADSGNTVSTPNQLRLNLPQALVFDANHYLYVADSANNRIVKIDLTNHTWTRFAGNKINSCGSTGTAGLDGIPAVSASVCAPFGLAFSSSGDLYFSEFQGHIIRKVVNGNIYLVKGVPNTPSPLSNPSGIAFAPNGDLYIANTGMAHVSVVSSNILSTYAGGGSCGTDGTLANTDLFQVADVKIDSTGNLYAVSAVKNSVYKIPLSTGVVTMLTGPPQAGCPGNSYGTQIAYSTGLAIGF